MQRISPILTRLAFSPTPGAQGCFAPLVGRSPLLLAGGTLFALAAMASPQTPAPDEFTQSIRPVLVQNCSACHNPNNPRNRINFLKAQTSKDLEASRGLWRNVAAQLRNRTMPPVESKLSEDDRLRISTWVDQRLRQTACSAGDFAGAVALRRLNRREYHNTIRDLLGVDFNVAEIFPADGTGGSGFDTNGETLFTSPLLMERYIEAAQQIVDRAIVTPNLLKTVTASEMLPPATQAASAAAAPATRAPAPTPPAQTAAPATQAPTPAPATRAPTPAPATRAPAPAPATQAPTPAPATRAPAPTTPAQTAASRELKPGDELTAPISIYLDGNYEVRVAVERRDGMGTPALKVDGAAAVPLAAQAGRGGGGGGGGANAFGRGVPTYRVQVRLARGLRSFAVVSLGAPVAVLGLSVEQRAAEPGPERLALHYRLLGTEPGAEPLQPRKAAEQVLRTFLRKAYRRPVEPADVNRILALYDRAAERGDPFEERMKLAIKGVLIGPDFLFKMERRSEKPGIYPIGQHELAARLSYFLWSTMPDEELTGLADQGRLQDPKVLAAQVDRLLDDPRSHTFAATFIGQWLGTQDVGGRVAPMLTELQAYYNPPVAADLRAEPVLIFERILGENRSLLDLLNGDYTYMTERLAKFYQLEDQFIDLRGDKPRLVQWPDNRRAGVLTLGSVMAMTSHYRQTSPVLRGAWVLETLLGTPVPPPPPNVPPLEAVKCEENCVEKAKTAVGMRQRIMAHRVDPACSACHNLMDPIGFALENFDWTGRWRDKEFDNSAIDTGGSLPSGEKFSGPVALREVLMSRKDDFLRHLTGKVLGYALGRNLQDGDSCTVQRLADTLQKDQYRARTLIREVVMSVPFRNSQGGAVILESAAPPPPKRVAPMVVK